VERLSPLLERVDTSECDLVTADGTL